MTWTNACSCWGVAVRKRNWRWWAGQTANSWRKPRFFLTTWDIATNWTNCDNLRSFIELLGGKNRNVVEVVEEENDRIEVVVVERENIEICLWWWWKKKTIEMWWWWWWWRREGGEGVSLYKCATFYLFLGLHSAPEKLTCVGSVPFAKNR